MNKLTYLILSILCASLQDEILAYSSDNGRAGPRRSRPKAWIIKGPTPTEMEQGIRTLYMDIPTMVYLTTSFDGLHAYIIGHAWAVHPHLVVARPLHVHKGCQIASFQGGKYKFFDIDVITPGVKGKVVLLFTKELILMDNGHRVIDGIKKDDYDKEEYDWIKLKVNEWIKKHTQPIYKNPSKID